MATVRRPMIYRQRIEWPTIAVAAAIYGGFGLLTWHADALPWWLVLPLGAYLVAWHGSLQHEVVHGHPTRWAWVNELLVLPSLWLWIPYRLYRESHLEHHRNENLTLPDRDPESYYMPAARWRSLPGWHRRLLIANNTLLGRFLIGPLLTVGRFWWMEARRLAAGDASHAIAWAVHLAGVGLVLGWVIGVCGLSLGAYLLLFAAPGISLSLLRSFLEHQARPAVGNRTVIVEAGPILSLLFLNNNLHWVHHDQPGAPWYDLPRRWRLGRDRVLAENGGYLFAGGYLEVARRHLLAAKELPVHPFPDQVLVTLQSATTAPTTPPPAAY